MTEETPYYGPKEKKAYRVYCIIYFTLIFAVFIFLVNTEVTLLTHLSFFALACFLDRILRKVFRLRAIRSSEIQSDLDRTKTRNISVTERNMPLHLSDEKNTKRTTS